jgi:hypothetical protein
MMSPTINEESDCLRKKNLRRRHNINRLNTLDLGMLPLEQNFNFILLFTFFLGHVNLALSRYNNTRIS